MTGVVGRLPCLIEPVVIDRLIMLEFIVAEEVIITRSQVITIGTVHNINISRKVISAHHIRPAAFIICRIRTAIADARLAINASLCSYKDSAVGSSRTIYGSSTIFKNRNTFYFRWIKAVK